MQKAAEAADMTNPGVLGQVGRAIMLVAEWYAGCSGYFPLEGLEANRRHEIDEPAHGRRAAAGTSRPM